MTIIDGRCLKVQVAVTGKGALLIIQGVHRQRQRIFTLLLHHTPLMVQGIRVDGNLPGLSFSLVELQFPGLYRQGAVGEQFALIAQPVLAVECQFPVTRQLHRALSVICVTRSEMQVLALTGNVALMVVELVCGEDQPFPLIEHCPFTVIQGTGMERQFTAACLVNFSFQVRDIRGREVDFPRH
ncbi:hypothetical protein [Photorhabdus sp. RM126S]|uniref:hypothetical protein n=1 Tax=Photorhabdus sp. RM126S TaxID=3342826 RepID=UPI0036DC05F3